jgi:anti-sigma factor RsiW
VKTHLTAFLDGELDEGLSRGIEEHLALCGACHAERQALERVRQAMDGMEMPAFESSLSPDGILDRARSEGRTSRPGKRRDRGWRPMRLTVGLRPAVVLATGLVVAALVWLVPFLRSIPVPTDQEVLMVERMDLFQNLDLIKDLSLLEGLELEEDPGGELS